MNNDLISRKALLEAYDKAHQGPPGGARKLIEEAPGVDAVEVVRCWDCIMEATCNRPQRLGKKGFCSYGERRTDGNL